MRWGKYMKKVVNLNKNNLVKILVYIIIFFIFLLNFSIIWNLAIDNYFNYGFASNIVNGMIPYRDFNMVLFPFSTFLIAFIMKIFGTKLIVYYVISSIIATLTIYLVNKLNKSVTTIIFFLLLTVPIYGYNNLSLLLFFYIIYLEKNKSNDYLIGFIISLLIMTNQKMILLLLPSIFTKDIKKIGKRLKSIIISFQILLIYLFTNNALYDFVDYTILGLFDFGSKNSDLSICFWIEIFLIIILLLKYLKNKDMSILYCLCFQIITFPIFDNIHLILGLVPFVFVTCSSSGKMLRITKLLLLIMIGLLLFNKMSKVIRNDTIYLNTDNRSNYYLTTASTILDATENRLMNYYYANIQDHDIYFLHSSWMYYYKLRNSVPINKFDLVFTGNNGYNGNKKLEKEIKNMHNSIFIIYDNRGRTYLFDQTNYELIDFIKDNYNKIDYLGNDFYVYEIVND